MKPKSRLIHIIYIAVFFIVAFAGAKAGDVPVFISLPEVGTLSTSTVNALHHDSNGFLWVGTDREVIVFDGFNALNTTLFDDNNKALKVLSFGELSDGSILVGTTVGVYTVDFSSEISPRYTPITGKLSEVRAIAEINDGKILIGDNKSLKLMSNDFKTLQDTELTDVSVTEIIPMDKNAYIGTNRGVYLYDYAGGKSEKIIPDSIDVSAMVRDRDNLYIATRRDGLKVLNLSTDSIQQIIPKGGIIMDIDKDSSANIYVATDGDGIIRYDSATKKFDTYDHTHGGDDKQLHNNQIYSLIVDNDDRIFLGFYMAGAEYVPYTQELFTNYRIDTDGALSVRALHADREHLLVGTRDGAFYIDRKSGDKKKIDRNQLGSRLVLAVEKVGDKYYLGAFGGGLSIYSPSSETVSRIPDAPLLSGGDVFSIQKDLSDNKIWVASSNGLFCIADGKVLKHIDRDRQNRPIGSVFEVYADSKGTIWVCTQQHIYNLDSSDELIENHNIKAEDVRQIMETRSHNYWFVTNSGTIEIYNSDFKRLPLSDRIKNLTGAKGVAEDANGNVWITSDNGVFRYSPRFDFLTQYLKVHGLKSPVFNSGKPVVNDDGIIYFCYSKGILTADTNKASDAGTSRLKAVPTAVSDSHGRRLLSNISNDNNGDYLVQLLTPQKLVKLYFSDFSYVGSDLMRYEYSLDNDDTWIKLPGDMSIAFTNLDDKDLHMRIRQLGNPHTETKVHIVNGMSSSGSLKWWAVCIIVLLVFAVLVVVIIRMRRRNAAALSRITAIDNSDANIPDNDTMNVVNDTAPDIINVKEEVGESADVNDKGENVAAGEENPEPKNLEPEYSTPESLDEEKSDEEKSDEERADGEKSKKYSSIAIPDVECEEIVKKLNKWLEESKAYTNPNLKLYDVVSAIGVSSHKLSYVLSQYLKTNYYDYLSRYRVEEFKRLAIADTKHVYSLVALSEMAGYNTKATFFRAFKKLEGITPGDFMKQIKVS